MSGLYILLFLLSLSVYHGFLATSTRVLTRQGYVHGIRQEITLRRGDHYFINKFLGIPYAQPPVKHLRFKPPQPLNDTEHLSSHNISRSATHYAPVCWQAHYYLQSIKLAWPGFDPSANMSDDCLYLNIYTPESFRGHYYPVIVYIHGGSYVAGTPIRDVSPGDYLPRRHVVLVTIQYRLGAFGFFTTGDSEAPGNLGLLDQVEALKWIQKNIRAFGGDKYSVTLLGESAGGSSVSLHYLSPLSRGLFQRGIAVSGVALTFFARKPKSNVLKASETLIKNLGCAKQSSRLTVECLQSKDGNDIVSNNTDHLNLQPFVDNNFLPDEPRKLLKEGRFEALPLMSGFVSNEGTNAISEPNITKIPDDYENYLNEHFFQKNLLRTKEQAPCAFGVLAFQYTPWHDLDKTEAYQKNIIDLFSDYSVIAPTHAVLSFHNSQGAPTYMFEFAHRSRNHPGEIWKGVQHEDTTAYKFGLPLLITPNPTAPPHLRAKTNLTFDVSDRWISDALITYLTNFAKTGSPNIPSRVNLYWSNYEKSRKAYLKIKAPYLAVNNMYHPLRMGFWNSYFPTLFPCREHKVWYGQCKKSEAVRQQSPKSEPNPTTLVRDDPNSQTVLW